MKHPHTHNSGRNGRGGPHAGSASSVTSAEEVEPIIDGCDASDRMHLNLGLELDVLSPDAQRPAEIDVHGIFDEEHCATRVEMGAASGNGLLDGGIDSGSSNNDDSVNVVSARSAPQGNSFGLALGNSAHSCHSSSMLGSSFVSLQSVPESQHSVRQAQEGIFRKSFGSRSGSIISVPKSRVHQPGCFNGVKKKSTQLKGNVNFDSAPAASMGQYWHDRRPQCHAAVDAGTVPVSPSPHTDPELSVTVGTGTRIGAAVSADSDLVNLVSTELDASNPHPWPRLRATVDSDAVPITLCGLCRPEVPATPQARAGFGPQSQVNVNDDTESSICDPQSPFPKRRQLHRSQHRVAADLGEAPELNQYLGGNGSGANDQTQMLLRTPAKENVYNMQYHEALKLAESMRQTYSLPKKLKIQEGRMLGQTRMPSRTAAEGYNMQHHEALKLAEFMNQTYLPQKQLKIQEGRTMFGGTSPGPATQEGSMFDTSSLGPHSPHSPKPQASASPNEAQQTLQQPVTTSGYADGTTARPAGAGADQAEPFQQAGGTRLSQKWLTMPEGYEFGTLGPCPRLLQPPQALDMPPLPFVSLDSARQKLERRVAASGFAETPPTPGHCNI